MPKIKNEITFIPKIKVHPSKIILFNEVHYSHHRPTRHKQDYQSSTLIQVEKDGKIELKRVSNKFLNSSRTSNGQLSKQAIKRLKLSIEYLLILNRPTTGKTGNTGRHYKNNITFITLTLPSKQIHTDKEIKEQCLNQFLIELHKFWRISNYVWRAEYQKNGNIHFHLLINRFVPWNDVQIRWNRIIKKLGYIDNYQKNMLEYHKDGFKLRTDLLKVWPADKQKKAYLKGTRENWQQPNSTDIHKISNIINIQAYLIKYMSKKEQEKQEETIPGNVEKKDIGRLWAASTILSNISGATTELDTPLEHDLEILRSNFKNAFFTSDYFTIIDINLNTLLNFKCLALLNLFYRYMLNSFQYNYQFTF